MTWNLNSERPVYLQLMERIQRNILSGTYRHGEKLPSVRELAAQATVNPNTMQKALQELERSGLIYTERTNGRYITTDVSLIEQTRKQLATTETKAYLFTMNNLGYQTNDILELLKESIDT